MKENLTEEERGLLAQFEAMDKWDCFVHEFTRLFVPLGVFVFAIGANSREVTILGVIVLTITALWSAVSQAQRFSAWRSLIRKLVAQCESRQPLGSNPRDGQ